MFGKEVSYLSDTTQSPEAEDAPLLDSPPVPDRGATLRFVTLSVPLTGFAEFDLHATGMAQLYLYTAQRQVGETRFDAFLDTVEKESNPWVDPLALTSTDREIARAVTYLWYTGAWPRLAVAAHADLRREVPNAEFVVAPSAYTEGLVWRTFNGHPMGAKPPGYGTWAIEPASTPSFSAIASECAPGEEPMGQQDEEAGAVDPAPHLLPGPRVSRDIPPSAVPTAHAANAGGSNE